MALSHCETCEAIQSEIESAYRRYFGLAQTIERAVNIGDIQSAATITVEMRKCEDHKAQLKRVQERHARLAHSVEIASAA